MNIKHIQIIEIIMEIRSGLNMPSLNFFFKATPIKYDIKLKVTPANMEV